MVKTTVCFAAMAALCASDAAAADAVLGWREAGEVSEGTQSERLTVGDGAELYKLGSGTWTLRQSLVDRQAPYAVNVVDGNLNVDAGAASAPSAVPDCITGEAAFWVDATTGCGLQTETDAGGVTRVTRWCDRREADPASRTRYSALPDHIATGQGNEDASAPAVTNVIGNACVCFGGVGSGQYMRFKTAADANLSLGNVVHFFLVHGCLSTWGPILGQSENRGDGGFRANDITGNATSGYTFTEIPGSMTTYFDMPDRGDQHGHVYTARYARNGRTVDAFSEPPSRGFELFSGTMNEGCQLFDNFFHQRTIAKVTGGDFLSEAILFTNRLSAAEVVEVERYLMAKWRLSDRDTATLDLSRDVGRISVASGATVSAAPASGAETGPLAFSGSGTVEKSGEGTLVIGPSGERPPFSGTFDLKAGKVSVRGGSVPAVAVKAGDILDARFTVDYNNSTVEQQLADGDDITLATGAGTGNFRKTGNAEARVSSVADGVRRISVEGGSLVLAAKTTAADPFGDTEVKAVNVTIPNAGFEDYFDANPSVVEQSNPSVIANYGWTGSNIRLYSTAAGGWATYSPGAPYAAEGRAAMLLKSTSAYAYTTVTIPQPGEYEFSCASTIRGNSGAIYPMGVYFGSTWNDAVRVGTLLNGKTPYPRSCCRFTVSAAGDYKLGFKVPSQTTVDDGYMVDDLKLRLVAESKPSRYSVPNGDFESVVAGTPIRAFPSTDMQLTGWTLDAGSSTYFSGKTNSAVAAVSLHHVAASKAKETYLSTAADRTVGGIALFFNGSGGKATSASFTPPAGTYRLVARAARWNSSIYDYTGNSERNTANATPAFSAILVRSDSSQVSLGSVSPRGHLFGDCVWPESFTVATDESISLVISQTRSAVALLDDLALVAADEADPGELVGNGGFELPYGADNFQATGGTAGYTTRHDRQRGGDLTVACNFGYNLYEGSYQVQIGCDDGVWETVSFPVPGLYRLRFAAHTRPAGRSVYGLNPINACLQTSDGSSVVTDIVTVRPFGVNWCEYSALFNVAAAGDYRLVIRGTAVGEGNYDRRSYLDGVSIRKANGVTASVPDLPEGLRITVADDARLQLDFTGTVRVTSLKLGGTVCVGKVDASTHPNFVCGAGHLEVVPVGTVIVIR